ncbi:hypothetical protein SNEBB_006643 [Seison nebaliae]|nr:hypothetical protein SNEBB_006643 [Seison nebaliae]
MTRHAKNSTAGTVYTYHERKKDSEQCGYGLKKERLTAASVKEFDCCNMTLQPCQHPMITEDGYLYDKEAIIEYILHEKERIKQDQNQQNRLKLKRLKEKESEKNQKKVEKVEKFIETNKNLFFQKDNDQRTNTLIDNIDIAEKMFGKQRHLNKSLNSINIDESQSIEERSSDVTCTVRSMPKYYRDGEDLGSEKLLKEANWQDTKTTSEKPLSNMKGKYSNQLPSFWLPSMLRDADKDPVNDVELSKKIDKHVRCPMSGKKIKLSRLIEVKFEECPLDEKEKKKSLIGRKHRYRCALTKDILTNKHKCCVLRSSGHVILYSAYENLIKKSGKNPFDGKKLTESDVIIMKEGSIGYAKNTKDLFAEKKNISLHV